MRVVLLLLSVSFLVLTSCKKQKQPDFHREYFGLQTGRYVIYDVMEITHDTDLAVEHDTLRYQLKTVWEGEYLDNEGRTASQFRRYKRATPTDPWQLADIWTGIYDGVRAELIEENQRTIKLVFAPSLTKEWNANAYNNLGAQDCYYSDVHIDTTINGVTFDSTVVVQQEKFYSLIDTTLKYEVYGKYVGLLYKHYKDNNYDFGNAEPQRGTEIYYHYLSHGFQ